MTKFGIRSWELGIFQAFIPHSAFRTPNFLGPLLLAACLTGGPWAMGETVNRIIAIVNDEVITDADVASQVSSIMDEQQLSDPTEAELLELHMMVLRNLIEQRLILQEAKKVGVTVGMDDVNKRLEAMRSRAGSEEQFQRRLAETALTEEKLREKIREQLLVQRIVEDKVRSSISVTPLEVSRALGAHP